MRVSFDRIHMGTTVHELFQGLNYCIVVSVECGSPCRVCKPQEQCCQNMEFVDNESFKRFGAMNRLTRIGANRHTL